MSHFHTFVDLINEYNFDILGFSETCLSSDVPMYLAAMSSNEFIRTSRFNRGADAGLYKQYTFKLMNPFLISTHGDIEQIST